jgi:hypothetical protein
MPLRTFLAAALAVCTCGLVVPAIAADRSAVVPFARGTLLLPVPDGFADPSELSPLARELIQKGMPSGLRLIAMLMDQQYLSRQAAGQQTHLSRYFLVQAERRTEMWGMTTAEFEAVKAGFRTQFSTDMHAAESQAQANIARAAKALGDLTGDSSMRITTGPENVLGVFEEGPDSISMLSIATVSEASKEGEREFAQIAATAFLRVQGRPLGVAVYSDYNSPDDIEWAKQAVHDWLTKIAALNAPTGDITPSKN